MAYTVNEYKCVVTGTLPNGEVWSNDWTALDVDQTTTPQAGFVDSVHFLYSQLAAILSNDWKAMNARVVRLSTGVSLPAAWESVTGAVTSDNMPTECAVRVSLDDQQGHRGGPFIAGWTTASLDTLGLLSSAHRTTLLGEVDALANQLVSEGWQLRIDRPTVLTTAPAALARVGEVFDVIRRRRNATSEDYASAVLV